jgi:hypothetical protein
VFLQFFVSPKAVFPPGDDTANNAYVDFPLSVLSLNPSDFPAHLLPVLTSDRVYAVYFSGWCDGCVN